MKQNQPFSRFSRLSLATLVGALVLMSPAILASSTPDVSYDQKWDKEENFTDEYQSGDFGRILAARSGALLIHEDPDPTVPAEEELTRNTPVFPGDRIRTRASQRVEIELAGGSLVRLDDGSELYFQALPDPYAGYKDNTVLNLVAGAVQVRVRDLGEDSFRVDTPSASVYLLGDGEYRIDILSTGETKVRSRRGVAELSGDGGSVLVRSGMAAVSYAGVYPSDPEPFSSARTDRFESWVSDRDDALRARATGNRNNRSANDYNDETVYEALPSEVQPYYGELSSSGRWAYVTEYGWVWYPSQVEAGWRPYNDGRWAYGSNGYFWVSAERWGWAPYHYGRWDHVTGFGWCWIPGRVFGGAWVSWSWGSAYVGWAPLNYWNRPVYYGTPYGYYCGSSWSFIGYSHFYSHHYHDYYVSTHYAYNHGHRGAVVTRPPKVSPRALSRDGEARSRAIRRVGDRSLVRHSDRVADNGQNRPRSVAGRKFRDREESLVSSASRSPGRRSTVRGSEPADSGRRTATSRNSSDRSNATRQLTVRERRTEADRTAPVKRPAVTRRPAPSSGTAPTRARRTTESKDSSDGVRDMYRELKTPRTREQRSTPTRTVAPRRNTQPRPSTSTGRSASPQRPTRAPQKAAPKRSTAPKKSSASRSKPSSSRSRSSAPKKSSSSRSSRPKKKGD